MSLTLLDAGNELRVMDGEVVFAVVKCLRFDGHDAQGKARWAMEPRPEWTVRWASPYMPVEMVEEAMSLLPKK